MKSIQESQAPLTTQMLSLTHANTKQPIYINSNLLFAWYWSEAHKATHLVSTNGGMIPVSETPTQVTEKAEAASSNNLSNNG